MELKLTKELEAAIRLASIEWGLPMSDIAEEWLRMSSKCRKYLETVASEPEGGVFAVRGKRDGA